MIHPRNRDDDSSPARRSALLSRILDPEYSGAASSTSRSLSPTLADLPLASVFVDSWGQQHDPDFRPFGSYPVITPDEREREQEQEHWPWDDDELALRPSRQSPTAISHSSSSYQSSSSGARSRSASVIVTPTSPSFFESDKERDGARARIASPGRIPRAALFPWTAAQRAVRVQHEMAKRHIPSPPPLQEEEPEIPLTLVDSRYVPGYGHVPPPHTHRFHTVATPSEPSGTTTKEHRRRSHTVPLPVCIRPKPAEDAEDDDDDEDQDGELPLAEQPQSYVHLSHPISHARANSTPSPSCSHSLRQSVYSLGLKTKLGIYHMKVRVRKASSAAKRPLSL
jgi:hypothetical protein